ncbi:protein translocase subunit SecD [Candidatus Pseudothioglobus singularis]|nr:protein translocase subunit SecD [Candidatus Pseudothioglobus singularis]
MNHYAGWKNALIVFFLFISTLYAIPNLYGSDLAIQITGTGDYVVQEKDLKSINEKLSENSVDYKSATIENNNVLIRFSDSKSQLTSKALLKDSLNRNYVVALNLAPSIPQWLSSIGGRAMSLGLDLRGGVHFLLEVDMNAVTAMAMDRYYNELRTTLRKNKLYKKIRKDEDILLVSFKTVELKNEAKKVIKSDLPDLIIAEGSEQALELGLEISSSAQAAAKLSALKQNITTLRNRVNELGVAEPIIQQQGTERIVVQLPGVQDTARAKEILGAVATIEFRMVDEKNDVQTAVNSGKIPTGSKLYKFKDGRPLLLKTNVITTGENIVDASSTMDENNQPSVSLVLDSSGGRSMLDTTKEFIGYRMAVVFIENKVETVLEDGIAVKKRSKTQDIINAATIQGTFSNRFQITGLDSSREATNLALLLRAGSLSAPVEIIEERTIGPSLGADNIQKGLISVLVGFALVLVFMAWRYRVFGLVANLALTINLITIVSILSLIQATLTLPGIAGIVLTVGMAVDANVLIFERVKEELKATKNIQKAISAGYEKALLTIADANITTLIASIVLFSFGTGAIKGFAVTLSIGIITSMFTAIIVSRAVINIIYGGKKIEELAI